MDIKAFKMDGLGNDFVIIDQRSQNFNLNKDQIIKICDRNFIGCDQLILIKKNKEIDADVEFYNSDGSVLVLVEMVLGVWQIFYQKKVVKKK